MATKRHAAGNTKNLGVFCVYSNCNARLSVGGFQSHVRQLNMKEGDEWEKSIRNRYCVKTTDHARLNTHNPDTTATAEPSMEVADRIMFASSVLVEQNELLKRLRGVVNEVRVHLSLRWVSESENGNSDADNANKEN